MERIESYPMRDILTLKVTKVIWEKTSAVAMTHKTYWLKVHLSLTEGSKMCESHNGYKQSRWRSYRGQGRTASSVRRESMWQTEAWHLVSLCSVQLHSEPCRKCCRRWLCPLPLKCCIACLPYKTKALSQAPNALSAEHLLIQDYTSPWSLGGIQRTHTLPSQSLCGTVHGPVHFLSFLLHHSYPFHPPSVTHPLCKPQLLCDQSGGPTH